MKVNGSPAVLRNREIQNFNPNHFYLCYRQEALQAAICEKDANIALLEMTSTKKQRNTEEIEKLSKEKEKLAQQLKELVRSM